MLHSNDSGYVHFYNDVVTELEALKSDFDITEQGSIMIEAYELIAEELFFDPPVNDNLLASTTAIEILSLYSSEK